MEQTICIFGDSLTWGAWDHEKGSWVNRLRLSLESENYDILVYNLGVDGDTTNELLKRFDVEAKARQPTAIIFQIGENDSIFIKSQNKQMVSLQQLEKNLQKLIDKAKKFTKVIIFFGCGKVNESKTTPIPWETDYYYTNQNLILYDKKIRDISNKNNIHYLPISNLLKNEDLDEDGLHPNSKGHQKLFLRVKDFLIGNKIL